MAAINTTFFQLAAAFFVAFILAHMTTKYFERFDRFPPPLVSGGPPGVIVSQQGRDYIPHRFRPTVPPGPLVPFPLESDATLRETAPPSSPTSRDVAAAPAIAMLAPSADPTRAPSLPYAMTSDEYLSFVPDPSVMPR